MSVEEGQGETACDCSETAEKERVSNTSSQSGCRQANSPRLNITVWQCWRKETTNDPLL